MTSEGQQKQETLRTLNTFYRRQSLEVVRVRTDSNAAVSASWKLPCRMLLRLSLLEKREAKFLIIFRVETINIWSKLQHESQVLLHVVSRP